MAATYIAAYLVANPRKPDGTLRVAGDVLLRERIEMAVADNARRIRKNDVSPGPGAESLYAKRQALATDATSYPTKHTDSFAYQLAVVNTITDASTDADLRQAVDSAWNAVAGVWAQEGTVA
jgi:hypothetical protein